MKQIISRERRTREQVQNESKREMKQCDCAYVFKYVREKNELESQQK